MGQRLSSKKSESEAVLANDGDQVGDSYSEAKFFNDDDGDGDYGFSNQNLNNILPDVTKKGGHLQSCSASADSDEIYNVGVIGMVGGKLGDFTNTCSINRDGNTIDPYQTAVHPVA